MIPGRYDILLYIIRRQSCSYEYINIALYLYRFGMDHHRFFQFAPVMLPFFFMNGNRFSQTVVVRCISVTLALPTNNGQNDATHNRSDKFLFWPRTRVEVVLGIITNWVYF